MKDLVKAQNRNQVNYESQTHHIQHDDIRDQQGESLLRGDILGLELLMDRGWFQTYGSDAKMTVQVSFGSEGGLGTSVPDVSIEVDDKYKSGHKEIQPC
jgi:hypothetical protein